MESDLDHHHHRLHHHHQIQHQQQPSHQPTSGLARYRSAPSSFFNDVLDRELCQQFFNRPSSPETERIFARFMSGGDGNDPLEDSDPPKASILNPQNLASPAPATVSPAPATIFYRSSNSKPPLPSQGISSGNELPYSMNSTVFPAMKTGVSNNNSGLIRHSSSPAGWFADMNIDITGFAGMRGVAGINTPSSNDASFSPPNRLKRTSSTGPMSPIVEITDEKSLVGGFPMDPWDDVSVPSGNIAGLKRLRDDYDDEYEVKQIINAESGNRPPMLSHHLSLPKTSAEMAAIDKFFQLQDSVPCKIRAKRGCATHPRSIAERVRRTKISERMRKLQELVPNMEKQTNTSDMLDLAVEYIKDLQKQVQTLSDTRAKCTCSNRKQQ